MIPNIRTSGLHRGGRDWTKGNIWGESLRVLVVLTGWRVMARTWTCRPSLGPSFCLLDLGAQSQVPRSELWALDLRLRLLLTIVFFNLSTGPHGELSSFWPSRGLFEVWATSCSPCFSAGYVSGGLRGSLPLLGPVGLTSETAGGRGGGGGEEDRRARPSSSPSSSA